VTQQRRSGGDSEAAAVVSLAAKTDSRVRPLAASGLVRAEVGRILALVDAEEPIRRRVVQDALNDALACTMRRRAELFEWARPRPGEYAGQATPAELAARDRLLAAQAKACRNKAILLELHILDDFEAVPDVH
jgi:hypothetical protein